jgi:uncharacterized protein YndB with AHSA1/START domain
MSTMTSTAQTTQVYSVFIKASPEQVWDAIVKPEFTEQYFYGVPVAVDEKRFDGKESAQGTVVEFDPPHRLVHSFRATWSPELADEPESRVSWEITAQDGGISQLTVVHDRLEAAPLTAENVAGGWSYILSGLKTLLETGAPLAG